MANKQLHQLNEIPAINADCILPMKHPEDAELYKVSLDDIKDFIEQDISVDITASFDLPIMNDITFGISGSSATWTAGTVVYKGTGYAISPGSTTKKYIIWDPASPTLFSVTDNQPSGDVWIMATHDTVNHVVYPATIGKIVHSNLIVEGSIQLSTLSGTFDDIDDGTTYAKVLSTSISAGKILLSEASGSLDNISDGSTKKSVSANEKTGASRAYTGFNATGGVIAYVTPKDAASPVSFATPPTGTGLLVAYDRLGFYDTGYWRTYMDNAGNFYLSSAATTHGLQWVQSTGSLVMQGTLRTGYTGQRMELSSDNNNLIFYDSNGNAILTIDDTLAGNSFSGMLLHDVSGTQSVVHIRGVGDDPDYYATLSSGEFLLHSKSSIRDILMQASTGNINCNDITICVDGIDYSIKSHSHTGADGSQLISYVATSGLATNASYSYNSDKVDNYHASDFSLSGHTHSYEPSFTTLGLSKGGTNATSYTAGQLLRMNTGGTAFESCGKTVNDFAASNHAHDYSGTYAALNHTHDYAASNHTHNYAASSHSHTSSDMTGATTHFYAYANSGDTSKTRYNFINGILTLVGEP